ncbi:hypothetical protein GCM10028867_25030 [Nocardioides pacificus]
MLGELHGTFMTHVVAAASRPGVSASTLATYATGSASVAVLVVGVAVLGVLVVFIGDGVGGGLG